MDKLFDMAVVDVLCARALQLSLGSSSLDPADPPHCAERLAGQILSSQKRTKMDRSDGSILVSAGFRLAIKLCCRILADPLRMHRGGARRDVNSVLTWLDKRLRDDP
jgi:hypothetical protein